MTNKVIVRFHDYEKQTDNIVGAVPQCTYMSYTVVAQRRVSL